LTAPDPATEARGTAEAVARRSYGRLLAFLAARSHDVAAAEDALSEAFEAALERWPRDGCPANPEGWLLTVARRRAIDSGRRAATGDAAAEIIRRLTEPSVPAEVAATIPDQRLAMMFACAHPTLDPGVHAPLMLQVVLGLDARAIAAAFLTSPAAMAKRLVRAKARIRDESIPLSVPEPEELPARLGPVLDAIYAAFTEGWGDPGGVDPDRRDLAEEGLFLARLITELLPEEPEAAGLLALMLYAESRRQARRSDDGEFVPLDRQDQRRWDWPMIRSANALLASAGRANSVGRYQLEAALQSAHILRHASGRPNWAEVVSLYDGLYRLTGSPVVLVNRALALAELEGVEAALAGLETVSGDTRLAGYQPYWVARGELLGRLGQADAAIRALEIALGLERDPAVRRFLQRRIDIVSA
jgi:RNA polymerase sigma-70 factor (ECF subfamily)